MSVLQFIEGYMSGNAWEDLCVMCYRMRYQDEHYTPISAAQGGDGGIEGFTQNGIVHQCYCPEKNYSDEDNYTHMRDKMTKDMIMTKSINIIDTGIGPAFLSPSHPKLSGSPKTGLASVRTYARPLAAFIIAKVAIKGGTFNFAIQKPLTAPHTVPTPTAVAKIIPKETRIPASG